VEQNEFRQDLFYRLNVFPIVVPPLRDRKEDIPLLADEFLARTARRNGAEPPILTPVVLEIMNRYDWPGNVRELQNVMERAVILTEPGEEVTAHILGAMFLAGSPETGRNHSKEPSVEAATAFFPQEIVPLEEIERAYILHALQKANGNRTHAAELLGISIRTLRNKLNELKQEATM
jgi:DNA-binding NtrC family response regulator